jgi:hypothetical protein
MSKGEKGPHLVIAAAKEDARFKAVQVRRHDHAVEIQWAKSLPAGSGTAVDHRQDADATGTWTALAAACGLTAGREGHDRMPRRHAACVVGLDSTAVAFYRVTAPAVEPQEMASIVRMQAESLLPLPPDQIEVAWRATPGTNGSVEITIAAARRELLRTFSGEVHDLHPAHIFLSCEGTAKAWQSLFDDQEQGAASALGRIGEQRTMLVDIAAQNTQVCMIQNGLVTQAAVLGTGLADLSDDAATLQHPESIERFGHDLRAVLGSFGWEDSALRPIIVLSDGGEAMSRLLEALVAAGLPVRASVPDPRKLKTPADFRGQDLYEYRTPLGLALMALEGSSAALDLFERIAAQEAQEKASSAWRSVSLAGAGAVAVLIALILTVYFTDVASAKRWTELVSRPQFEAQRQHQALLKTVARHRPDLLELLTCINAGKNDGIALDSLHFKKGQVVSIAGQAGNTEQMWAFEKNLRAQKDVKDVQIATQTQDSKTKKVKFTIQFSYQAFSRKDAVL